MALTVLPENRRLTPLVAITGAAGGLGKAFAVECASRGWDLFLTDLRLEALETLAGALRRTYGVRVLTQASDLTDPVSRAGLFDRIRSEHLRFGWLINVAGIDFEGPFYEQPVQAIRTIIRLNIEATLEVTHTLLEFRHPLVPFRIINVASLAAFSPMPVKAAYAASKRFLLDFSLALREEVRPLGATVTVLCPAGLPTTADCIQAIEAQGWLGKLTTQNTGSVAYETLNGALAGRPVCIPGLANRLVRVLGSLLPAPLVSRLVGLRWCSAHKKRNLRWVEAPV
jgi:short-subunit dehydrogenase